MNTFAKFQEAVVDARYELASELLLDMKELKSYNKKIQCDNLSDDFLEWLINFLKYLEEEKRKFYEE